MVAEFRDVEFVMISQLKEVLDTSVIHIATELQKTSDSVQKSKQIIVRGDGGTLFFNGTIREDIVSVNIFAPTYAEANNLAQEFQNEIRKLRGKSNIKKITIERSSVSVPGDEEAGSEMPEQRLIELAVLSSAFREVK